MYKVLNIGGEDYKLEYTIEASLYADCVERITTLMAKIGGGEDDEEDKEYRIRSVLSGIANVPATALTVFYAGLMEAHGNHPDGDGKVPDIATAKKLIAQYIREHKEDETGNFYGVMELCLEKMGEDGFFKLIGLEAMTEKGQEKKAPKLPQDHKKKQTKASEK